MKLSKVCTAIYLLVSLHQAYAESADVAQIQYGSPWQELKAQLWNANAATLLAQSEGQKPITESAKLARMNPKLIEEISRPLKEFGL